MARKNANGEGSIYRGIIYNSAHWPDSPALSRRSSARHAYAQHRLQHGGW